MGKKKLPKPVLESELHSAKVELEIKRFYIPVKLTGTCLDCEQTAEQDLNDQYLSYPTLGIPETVTVTCGNEDCESFEQPVAEGELVLSLTARLL